MHRLADFTESRDNNFNLIRFVAASLVIFSHSYPLLGGDHLEPLKQLFGFTAGTIAVDIFFITSGLLITWSFINKPVIIDYAVSRVLRIFPALLCAVALCAFIVGPLFTKLSAAEYFSDSGTYRYWIQNSLIVMGVQHTLPGVFTTLPHAGAVNGSLWTLPYEIYMYTLTVITLVIMSKAGSLIRVDKKWLVLLVAFTSAGMNITNEYYQFTNSHFFRLHSAFFIGASAYLFRDHILLSKRILAGVLLSVTAIYLADPLLVKSLYTVPLAYVVLYLSYIPRGKIRSFNDIGDYSYGLYIYAFPIQQILVLTIPELTVSQLTALSFTATLALAYASWNIIEKRALAIKSRVMKHESFKYPAILSQRLL